MKNNYDEVVENSIEVKAETAVGERNNEPEKEAEIDDRNFKEKIYDKIPISLKALDILITILITIFVLIMLYFIIKKFS